MTISKDNLIKGFIGFGIASLIAVGISEYLLKEKSSLTYPEMLNLIGAYNSKIQEIKQNCDNDIRCIIVDEEKRVKVGNIKSEKEIIDKLNEWIREDNEKYLK